MSSWLVVAVVSFLVGAIFGAGVLAMVMTSDDCTEIDAKAEEQRLWEEKFRKALRGRYR